MCGARPVRVGERTSDRSLGGAKLVGSSVCHRAVLRGVAGVEPVTPSKPYSCGWVAGMLRAAAAAAAQRRMIWREASRSRLPSTKPQAGAVRQIQGQGKNQGQFRNSPQSHDSRIGIGHWAYSNRRHSRRPYGAAAPASGRSLR
jgi:hypothetical protein